MKANLYNEALHTIKDTNDMGKEVGKPLQQKLKASLIADFGLTDPDVMALIKRMYWV